MGDVHTDPKPTLTEHDRICVEPDCGAWLSRYNDGAHCALHAPMQVPRTRGRKIWNGRCRLVWVPDLPT